MENIAKVSEAKEIRLLEASRETSNHQIKPKAEEDESKTGSQNKKVTNKNLFHKGAGTTNVGNHYEDYMVAKLVLDCIKNPNIQNFQISSNDANFGKFDDVVFEITTQDQIKEKWAFQLKHYNKEKVLPLNNLTASRGNFSILKYFENFQKIKDSIHDFNLILMTNLKFDAQDGTPIQISDDESFQVKIYETKANKIINTSEKKKHCYRFEIAKSGTICPFSEKMQNFDEFFKKFYLYTDQANVGDIEKYVAEKFKTLFGCDNSFSSRYIKFIEKWNEREGMKEKLDRNMMHKVIALYLLSPFIHPFCFGPVHENAKIFQRAVNEFTVTLVDKNSLDKCRRIWGDAKNILEKTDIKEINRIIRKYELNFDFEDNLDKLSPKECTQLLWFIDTKIPLIVSENPLIFQAIKLCEDRPYVLIRDNESNKLSQEFTTFEKLSDLTIHSDIVNDLTKKFKCQLPTNEFSLDCLIQENEEFWDVITTNELLEMVERPYLVGKETQEKLPVPYIMRHLSVTNVDFQYLETVGETTFVMLSNVKCEEVKKYYNKKNFSIKTDEGSRTEFKTICRDNQKMKNFRHFRLIDGRLQLIQNVGDISDVEKFRTENSYINETTFYNQDKHNNINVIIDEPGMGKSVLLRSLKNNVSSTLWTIILLPNDISEICRFARKEKDLNKIDNFIIELKYAHYKKIDKMILQLLMKRGQIVYLWDALDEIILDEDLTTIMEIIHNFSQRDPIQWITSRHHLKETLENKFNIFSFKINSFDDEEQTCYIHGRLNAKEKIDDITQSIKNNIAFAANTNILGIPLQLFMLTELFLQNEEIYSNLMHNNLLSLSDLYRYFVEEKFNFHYKNKIQQITPQLKQILERDKKNKINHYMAAALKLLIDKKFLSALNLKYDDFLKEIQENGDDIGFVIGVTADGKNVKFLHNSYAEYFVALYLVENYKDIPHFENVLFHKRHTNIRLLFDCLLAGGSVPHIAVLNRNLETLKKYENQLKDCKDKGGRNLLHLAASWGDTYQLKEVLEKRDKTYWIFDYDGEVLRPKSPKYDLEMIKYLLEKCDVQELDDLFKLNCFSYAERSGCLLNLIFIENCKRTGYINSKSDKFICNILFYSSLYGYEGIFESHNNINHYNIVTHYDQTLLHVACNSGHFKIVNFLIKSGVEINSTDHYKCTPLHYAAMKGHYDITQKLIKSGAIIDAATYDGATAVDLAVEYGHYTIADMLNKYQSKEENLDGSNLPSSDITKVVEQFGRTPLHIAAENGNYQKAVSEISLKKDVDVVDRFNKTPLVLASFDGHQNIVELLINSGATVNLADTYGSIPLHYACLKGHQDVVQLLINFGATVNAANKEGFTPLRIASFNGRLEIVQFLINSGATVNLVDNVGNIPLHLACDSGHQDVVQLLINSGATVNVGNKSGFTPLCIACFYGHQEVVQLLINSGAAVNFVDNVGDTPLHLACFQGHQEVVQLLIASGATINALNKDGFTPLRIACHNGHQEIVQLLINAGAADN